jgi:hypothetical protein
VIFEADANRSSARAFLQDVSFEFRKLPTPIPGGLRPTRRIALLLLLVAKSHGSGASWKGLQLLNWAIRDQRHTELLAALWANRDIPDRPIVRFEPALDRAIDLAVGLHLLEVKASQALRLTDAGRAAVVAVEKTSAFEIERALLERIPGRVTKVDVDRALEWRDR